MYLFYFVFLRQSLIVYFRLVLNSLHIPRLASTVFSCLSLPNSGIKDLCHYAWLTFLKYTLYLSVLDVTKQISVFSVKNKVLFFLK